MSPERAPLLNVSKLVKRFGGFHALDGLSFHVSSGEILGLVGPNGSGKTTAINVISGLYAPDGGELVLDGASIGGVASHRLVHRGINRTFQIPKPFLSLTVRQNVEVALAYGGAATTPPALARSSCRTLSALKRDARSRIVFRTSSAERMPRALGRSASPPEVRRAGCARSRLCGHRGGLADRGRPG